MISHCHASDSLKKAGKVLRDEIIASASTNRAQPGQILADKLIQHPVEVRVAAGNKESLKRAIRRAKRGTIPAEPDTISSIPYPLPAPYTTTSTTNNLPFLAYDNGAEVARVLVYCSRVGLDLLGQADTWFMDGTHSTAPRQFAQLFCIRVPLGDGHATAAYGLLPGKHQEHYEEFLTAILDACLREDVRPSPSTVIMDYENAIHNAVLSVIGQNSKIQGCFYHLTQSTWRRMQSEGLQALYRQDEEVRHFCGMLDGLAFLPTHLVSEGMAHLRTLAPDALLPVVDYFDATYVTGTYRTVMSEGKMRFRAIPPRFPPALWNVHEATINGDARTNNVCESWNCGFRHLVGRQHPSFWKVVECVQKDNAMVESDFHRHTLGVSLTRKRKKNTIAHQSRLNKLCRQIVNKDLQLPQFLESIGNCVRLS